MRLGKLRMLLEDRDREVDDLRSLLADREGRIQQLVQDLHQRPDGGEGDWVAWQQCTGRGEGSSAKGAHAARVLLTTVAQGGCLQFRSTARQLTCGIVAALFIGASNTAQ